jgi:hypothetical protein
MPPVELEPTISVLERAKTARALDRATTVIGSTRVHGRKIMHIGPTFAT